MSYFSKAKIFICIVRTENNNVSITTKNMILSSHQEYNMRLLRDFNAVCVVIFKIHINRSTDSVCNSNGWLLGMRIIMDSSAVKSIAKKKKKKKTVFWFDDKSYILNAKNNQFIILQSKLSSRLKFTYLWKWKQIILKLMSCLDLLPNITFWIKYIILLHLNHVKAILDIILYVCI